MEHKTNFTDEQLRYLRMLAHQYPTVQAASKEIIRLNAILNLPKGTEHFMSDIHGEYDAFFHAAAQPDKSKICAEIRAIVTIFLIAI